MTPIDKQADAAFRKANFCAILLETGWYEDEEEQELRDQLILAKVEGKVIRSFQNEHWSDAYKTKDELWREEREIYVKETSWRGFKEELSLTLGWFLKSSKITTKKVAGLISTGSSSKENK